MADKPSKDASRGDWDEYAESLGLNPDEFSNKESLIEAVEAEELASAVDDDDDTPDADAQAAAANADDFGGGEPPEVTPGVKGEYPEGYEDATDGWKAAFDHAVAAGNPVKTSIVFADINCDNEEFSG